MPGSKPGRRGGAKSGAPAPESRARAPQATPDLTAERVDHIADLMRRLAWERGHTATLLAAEWGLAVSTVENYAAEAWRRVAAGVKDPEVLRDDVSVFLRARLAKADSDKSVGILSDVLTRIQGARAPEKIEHMVRVEGMPPAAVLARIDEAIARLQEFRAQVAAEVEAAGGTTG